MRDASVARRIVAHSGLAPPDLVIEPGAGDGLLTEALAARARNVIAVEIDRERWTALRARAAAWPNVEPVLGDFFSYPLPRRERYQVVGNLPFSLTSAIVRRLVWAPNPPASAALVVQREAALHWSGQGRESVAGVLAKVGFAFSVPTALRRTDFVPFPAVESLLLRVQRRDVPAIPPESRAAFEQLVLRGFGGGKPTLARNLRTAFPATAVGEALDALGFRASAPAAELPFDGWLALFAKLHPACDAPPFARRARRG